MQFLKIMTYLQRKTSGRSDKPLNRQHVCVAVGDKETLMFVSTFEKTGISSWHFLTFLYGQKFLYDLTV